MYLTNKALTSPRDAIGLSEGVCIGRDYALLTSDSATLKTGKGEAVLEMWK